MHRPFEHLRPTGHVCSEAIETSQSSSGLQQMTSFDIAATCMTLTCYTYTRLFAQYGMITRLLNMVLIIVTPLIKYISRPPVANWLKNYQLAQMLQ